MNVKKLILASLLLAVTGMILLSGCKSKMAKAPCPKSEAATSCAKAEKQCLFAKMFSSKKKQPCPVAAQPCPASPCAPGMVVSCEKYSGAEKGTPVLRLQTMVPEQVIANQPFDYRVTCTNLTDHEVDNVIIVSTIPEGMEIKSSSPEQMTPPMEGRARWLVGKLGAKCSQTINAAAVASSEGTLKSCADVFYATCANINIVQPKLAITKSAPSESLMCDRIPLTYVITNKGSGSACNVTIEDNLQDGLTTSDGSNRVVYRVDSLGAGQSKKFDAMVDASKPGRYASMAIATWQGAKVESEMPATMVSRPELAISGSGPEKEYMGRPLTYDITVTNSGDGVAKDTVVEAWLPDTARFESATSGGQYTHMSPGKVTWHLGQLAPDATEKITVTFACDQVGSADTKLVAKAFCAETASGETKTQIAGAPGLLVTLEDVADPIVVGQNATYIISVLNQGEIPQTNIRITCTLSPDMEYVSSSGPTEGTFADGKLVLSPHAKLGPKEKVTWQIVVKATGVSDSGDERFQTSTMSDALSKPVEKDESTHFYK